jgi:hypothetical protein
MSRESARDSREARRHSVFSVSSKLRRLATLVRPSRVARRSSSACASLLHRHVAQGLHHGDQLAGFVVDGAGVGGQIEPGAETGHLASSF